MGSSTSSTDISLDPKVNVVEANAALTFDLSLWFNLFALLLTVLVPLAYWIRLRASGKQLCGQAEMDKKSAVTPKNSEGSVRPVELEEGTEKPAPPAVKGLIPGLRPPMLHGNDFFRCLIVIQIISMAAYVSFRMCTFWLTAGSTIFFLFTEVPFNVFGFVIATIRWTTHDTKRSVPNLRDVMKYIPGNEPPTVTVLVPTYDEDVDMLEKTIRACCTMDYPTKLLQVYLLDDGKRPEMESLIKDLRSKLSAEWADRLHYVARTKEPGKPHYAKAGNLNHALKEVKVQGDYLAIFDADMVPSTKFLQRTIPLFYQWDKKAGSLEINEKLAIIQTPQVFNNVPCYDFLDVNQGVWYYSMAPALDSFHGMPFCGTNALLKRSALVALPNGGLPYGSLTEDLHTSAQLMKAGYHSRYTNERLVVGVAPPNLVETMKQRTRWSIGAMQVLEHEPLFFDPGNTMTFLQRFGVWMMGGCCFLHISTTVAMFLSFSSVFTQAPQLDLLPAPPGGIGGPLGDFEIIGLICAGVNYWMQYVLVFSAQGNVPFVWRWRMATAFITYMPSMLLAIGVSVFKIPYKFTCTPKGTCSDWDGAWGKQNSLHFFMLVTILCAIAFEFERLNTSFDTGGMASLRKTFQKNEMPILWLLITIVMLSDVIITICWPLPKQERSSCGKSAARRAAEAEAEGLVQLKDPLYHSNSYGAVSDAA